MKPISLLLTIIFIFFFASVQSLPQIKAGGDALGTQSYDKYDKPEFCGTSCHTDFYQQWKQAMMSQAK